MIPKNQSIQWKTKRGKGMDTYNENSCATKPEWFPEDDDRGRGGGELLLYPLLGLLLDSPLVSDLVVPNKKTHEREGPIGIGSVTGHVKGVVSSLRRSVPSRTHLNMVYASTWAGSEAFGSFNRSWIPRSNWTCPYKKKQSRDRV